MGNRRIETKDMAADTAEKLKCYTICNVMH